MRSSRYRFIDDAKIVVAARDDFSDVEAPPPYPDGIVWIGLDCSTSAHELFPIIIWHDYGKGLNFHAKKLPEIIGNPESSYCKVKFPTFSDELTDTVAIEINYNILPVDPSNTADIGQANEDGGLAAVHKLCDDINNRGILSKRVNSKENKIKATFNLTFLEKPACTRIPFFIDSPSSEDINIETARMSVPVYLLTVNCEDGVPGREISTRCSIPCLESEI